MDMRRREVFGALVGAMTLRPCGVWGQQASPPTIGILHSASPEPMAALLAEFRAALREVGYSEGQNVLIEYCWARGQFDRLPDMAEDLVRRRVAVLVAMGMPAPLVAKSATQTIPIVFSVASDPVKMGLVSDLSRPSGNLTGATALSAELVIKQFEFLRELVPSATKLALLLNPSNPMVAASLLQPLSDAAQSLGLQLDPIYANNDAEIDSAVMKAVSEGTRGLIVGADPFFTSRSANLASLTTRLRLPTASYTREFAISGGLLSYVGSFSDLYRLAGTYAGRILKGAKPSELPVVQSSKAELFLNLKTAKDLGINVPLSILGRANVVFE
jgi:putative ABC transport system substrate-binding protein